MELAVVVDSRAWWMPKFSSWTLGRRPDASLGDATPELHARALYTTLLLIGLISLFLMFFSLASSSSSPHSSCNIWYLFSWVFFWKAASMTSPTVVPLGLGIPRRSIFTKPSLSVVGADLEERVGAFDEQVGAVVRQSA